MGRAVLLLVTGSFIIFSLIQLSVFNRQAGISDMNVSYFYASQARNIANSGIEMAFYKLSQEPNWRTTLTQPHVFTIGNHRAEVLVVDNATVGITLPYGVVEIRSKGFYDNNRGEADARARVRHSQGLPAVDAAMGIFTENLDFDISGSSFLISGHDRNPDGTAGPFQSLPGIAVNNPSAYQEIMSELNSTQKNRIQGSQPDAEAILAAGGTLEPGHPSLAYNPAMDASDLEAFIQKTIPMAHHTYVNHTAHGAGSLGTPADPKIIVVEGTLNVQNATGAGIIIIKEGGRLDAADNFDNYQGLIVIQGAADLTRGNINIYGAMLFGGDNPTIEIDIDFRGNVNIQYSSLALTNISNTLFATSPRKHTILTFLDW